MLRKQNRELLEQLAIAQEFISGFPQQITNARLDKERGIDTKYNYLQHNYILSMSGGSHAIRSQLNSDTLANE